MFTAMMGAFMEEVVGFLFNLEVTAQPAAQAGLIPGPDGRAVPMSDEVLDQLIASGPDPDGPGVEEHAVPPVRHSAPPPEEPEDGSQQRSGAAKADDPYAGVGRNSPCPCGSGKKFKLCHGRAGVN